VPVIRKGSAVRVWVGVAVCVAILLAIIFADDGPAGSSQTGTPADAPAVSTPTTTVAVEPNQPVPVQEAPTAAPGADSPPPTDGANAQGSKPATNSLPTAHDPAGPAKPGAVEPRARSTAKPAAPATAEGAVAPAAVEPPEQPTADQAAPTTAEGAAVQPVAALPQGAEAPSTQVPAAPGDYVIDFVSRPNGATITIDEHTLTAPGEMNIGAMPNRVKVFATKAGYLPSSAWVDRSGFQRVGGVFRRRVYMSLPTEDPSTAPPKNSRRP